MRDFQRDRAGNSLNPHVDGRQQFQVRDFAITAGPPENLGTTPSHSELVNDLRLMGLGAAEAGDPHPAPGLA